jgi:hypothetical protein
MDAGLSAGIGRAVVLYITTLHCRIGLIFFGKFALWLTVPLTVLARIAPLNCGNQGQSGAVGEFQAIW